MPKAHEAIALTLEAIACRCGWSFGLRDAAEWAPKAAKDHLLDIYNLHAKQHSERGA
jgi:hypothetical protein